MAERQWRYGREEFARRGQEIYDRVVRPRLRPGDDRKFVAIDIETADFEIDGDELAAINRLSDRHDDAQVWLMRVGEPAAHSIGWSPARGRA